ncbi:hypothetical protein DEO72_LG11g171 [Vigna unguiculata]|uniref:Uncharacterized protein n=1 Tax=Vigna unguiculata TaxID=3917 RepID=A0A4D6NIN8_VIGUN|nr:hypothetical protein DEO72_LG11g171 [Vigna unguiculata]
MSTASVAADEVLEDEEVVLLVRGAGLCEGGAMQLVASAASLFPRFGATWQAGRGWCASSS